jgi:hypothetical protein
MVNSNQSRTEFKLILSGVRPYSINAAYYRGSFNMTQECRTWRKTVIKSLSQGVNQAELDTLRESFVAELHALVVKITFNLPHTTYFTLKGDINAKSMDLSNIEKLLIDIIMDERFFTRGEVRNANINDKYIIKLHSEKNPSLQASIMVDLYIVNRPQLSVFKALHSLDQP